MEKLINDYLDSNRDQLTPGPTRTSWFIPCCPATGTTLTYANLDEAWNKTSSP